MNDNFKGRRHYRETHEISINPCWSIFSQQNWTLFPNSKFQIPIYLQPSLVDLGYFTIWIVVSFYINIINWQLFDLIFNFFDGFSSFPSLCELMLFKSCLHCIKISNIDCRLNRQPSGCKDIIHLEFELTVTFFGIGRNS